MKRVKLLWLASVLAAVTLGIVFLRCVGGDTADVEEPLAWRSASEIQVSYMLPDSLNDTLVRYIGDLLDTMDAAVNQGVKDVLENEFQQSLKEEQRNSIADAISESSDSIIIKMMESDDLKGYLRYIMENDPVVSEIIEENGLSDDVEDIVNSVATEVESSRKEVKSQLDDFKYFPPEDNTEPMYIDLGGDVRDFLNNLKSIPKVTYTIKFSNVTPLEFKIYVLLFEGRKWSSKISAMTNAEFQNFVDTLSNDPSYVNLLCDGNCKGGGMEIFKGQEVLLKGNIPVSLITGESSPFLKLLIVQDIDDPGPILGGLRELKEKRKFVDVVKLNIKIDYTNDLGSLFGLFGL